MRKIINKIAGKYPTAIALTIAVVAFASATYATVEYLRDKFEKSAQAAIASNVLKHKKDTARLKTAHKKEITTIKTKHKKDLAKTKFKERSKRWFAGIPILGTALLFWSGKEQYADYEEWHIDNPEKTYKDFLRYQADLVIEH